MGEGILYIASGGEYIDEARRSAESVKRYTDLPVTIVSDRPLSEPCFDTVIEEDDFCYHYGDSVLQIPELPYDRTLLLDTDTVICDELDDLFALANEFDIAVATIADGVFSLDDKVPQSFPEYNTGVVLFDDNPKTNEFIDEWKAVYREYLDDGVRMNQPAFREVLYRSSLRVATLPTEYNCRANFGGYLNTRVKILHGDIDDSDAVRDALNGSEVPRVFYNDGGELRVERIETLNSLH